MRRLRLRVRVMAPYDMRRHHANAKPQAAHARRPHGGAAMPPESERLPPQNLDAERSVLGSMLRDNKYISDVVNVVRAEHFYTDAHQKIFQAISTLYINRGQPADLVTLAEFLKQEQQIEDVGGYPYLAELWDAAPTAANAEH